MKPQSSRLGREKKTKAKFIAKQQLGLPLMSREKLEVPIRSRVLKPITRVAKTIRKKSNNSWYDLTKFECVYVRLDTIIFGTK